MYVTGLVHDSPLRLNNTPQPSVFPKTIHVHVHVHLITARNILVTLPITSIANKMPDLPKKVGWIGLGIMGGPMLRNLLGKMDNETQFYIYDVVQKSIDDFVEEGQGRVHACSSSKEVADLSVCCPINNQHLPVSQH